jgi:polysaccharide export outer membrane protein
MRNQARALMRAVGCLLLVCLAMAAVAQPAAQRPAPPASGASQGSAPPRAAQPESGATQRGAQPDTGAVVRYEVQPSDVLQVSVWRDPELTQQVIVRPDGAFSFPLAGEINAVGKTVEELRRELVERLARYIPDVVVTVAVLEIKGNKIYVIGQVNQPGEFIVNPRVDVMQALSLAGGTTAFASPSEIFVLRRDDGQQRRLPFNFDAVLRGRDLEQNVLLRTGDVVVVP